MIRYVMDAPVSVETPAFANGAVTLCHGEWYLATFERGRPMIINAANEAMAEQVSRPIPSFEEGCVRGARVTLEPLPTAYSVLEKLHYHGWDETAPHMTGPTLLLCPGPKSLYVGHETGFPVGLAEHFTTRAAMDALSSRGSMRRVNVAGLRLACP